VTVLARVFPRRTNATPIDDYAFIGDPPLFIPDDITEIHVSAAFTWDLPDAERLAAAWSRVAPVKIGGPATGMRGENFVPGRYLRDGYVITSRGCPNRCWFCGVPKREGALRELPITAGFNVLDDNLLACSDAHIRGVFDMLSRQPRGTALFTGGLEAARLKPWHIEHLRELRPKRVYFAYDTPDDLPPLAGAARMLHAAGYRGRGIFYCYVLVGAPGDTFTAAEFRLRTVMGLNMTPMAMLYRDDTGRTTLEWRKFQRSWARPAAIYATKRTGV
jgi:hypothetical protein